MSGTQALTAVLVLSIILLLVGFLGLGFSDPFSDPTGWYVVIGLGFVMLFGGILFVTVAVGTAKQQRGGGY